MKKVYSRMLKETNGITLIALVITIVVLIMLAAVAINISLGENGIFNRAKYASEFNKYSAAKERLVIKLTSIAIECEEKHEDYDVYAIEKALRENDEEFVILEEFTENISKLATGVSSPGANRKLKKIVVASDESDDYKFIIQESGQIQGVTKEKVEPDTPESVFVNISTYEEEQFGISGSTQTIGSAVTPTPIPTSTPTPTPTPTPIDPESVKPRVVSAVRFNTYFADVTFSDKVVSFDTDVYREAGLNDENFDPNLITYSSIDHVSRVEDNVLRYMTTTLDTNGSSVWFHVTFESGWSGYLYFKGYNIEPNMSSFALKSLTYNNE